MQSISRKTLTQANGSSQTLHLNLDDNTDTVWFDDIIRIIPNKRLVAFGRWKNQNVAIKLFYAKKWAKYSFSREIAGIEALVEANVPTPKLLFKGTAENKKIFVLIYEKIPAQNLEMICRNKNNLVDLLPLMRAMVIELATQHVLGILQCDLHLKNFLVTDKNIYTLDGGKIYKFDYPLDKKTSMKYLSLLLVQFGIGITSFQQELFSLYAKSRGWLVKPSQIDFFKKMMVLNNQIRWRHYQKKIFRTCSAFRRINKWNKVMVYDRNLDSKDFQDFLKNPEHVLSLPDTIYLKKGRSSTVAKVNINNQFYILKRYNVKNFAHWLRRCFRKTRAAKSWRISQYLYAMNIPVPKPIAFIEQRFFGLRGTSYFLMEFIDGMHADEYFSQVITPEGFAESSSELQNSPLVTQDSCSSTLITPQAYSVSPEIETYSCISKNSHVNVTNHIENENKHLQQVAKKIWLLLLSLRELKITHGDLKKTNILIANHQPYLLDLDGSKEFKFQWSLKKAFKKDVERFLKNWSDSQELENLFKKNFVENS